MTAPNIPAHFVDAAEEAGILLDGWEYGPHSGVLVSMFSDNTYDPEVTVRQCRCSPERYLVAVNSFSMPLPLALKLAHGLRLALEGEKENEVAPEPPISNRDAVRYGLDWVRAALDCKDWSWDSDQREAAEEDLARAYAALEEPAPPAPAEGGGEK